MYRQLVKYPSKIIELNDQDARLRCLVTGDEYSAHLSTLRKLNLNEFIQYLRDIKQVGTINFKRPSPGKPPFSDSLDKSALLGLDNLFNEEMEDNDPQSNSQGKLPNQATNS